MLDEPQPMKRDRGARTSEVNGHNEAAVAGTDATGLPLAIDDATSARVKINRGPPGMAEEVDTSGERARRISVLELVEWLEYAIVFGD